MQDYRDCIKKALEFCLVNSKGYSSSDDIVSCLKSQDCMIHSRFRYSIALDIAGFLVDHFGGLIKGMNLYGSTMEYTAGMYSDIDMILRVTSSNDEILQMTRHMNRYLTDEYYSLIGQIADEYCYLLDMHIIDDNPDSQRHPSKAYLEHILGNESVVLC